MPTTRRIGLVLTVLATMAIMAAVARPPLSGHRAEEAGGKPLNTPNPKTTVIIDYIDAKGGKGKPKGGGEEAVDHSAGHYELLGGV